jgi:hypothetical protein
MMNSPIAPTITCPPGRSMICAVRESVPFLPELPEPVAARTAVIPMMTYTTALPAEVTRLRTLVNPSSSRWPNPASSACQTASRNMPIARAQTMACPNGCSASCWTAPEESVEPSRSPNASWIASHAMSRWTTP